MIRACKDCEWFQSMDYMTNPPRPTGGGFCREGPVMADVLATHWCGRFHPREADVGYDGREKKL